MHSNQDSRSGLVILGSTGSIGRQTLDVCRRDQIPVDGLVCGRNVPLLLEQIREFRPRHVALAAAEVRAELEAGLAALDLTALPVLHWGTGGVDELLEELHPRLVLAAMVGISGLRPVLKALDLGADIALANKEVLVTGGELVTTLARERGCKLLPVDSEHSAIWQCLQGQDCGRLKRLILTASGGPFRKSSLEAMRNAGPQEALAHPNWKMGAKISIDSATMMNKGLELIEAQHLFDCPEEHIDILIHPQSIVHSMVEFKDGALLAQLGAPDMRQAISLALHYPRRAEETFSPLDLLSLTEGLSFEAADPQRFRSLHLAREAARAPKSLAVVMNAANEVAVEAFLARNVSFLCIAETVENCMEAHQKEGVWQPTCFEEIAALDQEARQRCRALLK